MTGSVLQTFRDLDRGLRETLADLSSPLLLAFATLSIADKKCGVERLSAEHITACLEAAGVSVSKKSISTALSRAAGRISISKNLEGESLYRLMIKGEREIAPHLGGTGLTLVRFDGNSPRTARLRLGQVLAGLKGLVRISDPYYGVRTLDSLEHVPNSCEVRFLTGRTSEQDHKLRGAFGDFTRERPRVEFRRVGRLAELHDRYVLAENSLLLVGHGLKDVGSKESFIVRIDERLAPDLIDQTSQAFEQRWGLASPLTF